MEITEEWLESNNIIYAPGWFLNSKGEKVTTASAANIVDITKKCYYRIPADEKGKVTYIVTVLDRLQNESKGVKCKVKL